MVVVDVIFGAVIDAGVMEFLVVRGEMILSILSSMSMWASWQSSIKMSGKTVVSIVSDPEKELHLPFTLAEWKSDDKTHRLKLIERKKMP